MLCNATPYPLQEEGKGKGKGNGKGNGKGKAKGKGKGDGSSPKSKDGSMAKRKHKGKGSNLGKGKDGSEVLGGKGKNTSNLQRISFVAMSSKFPIKIILTSIFFIKIYYERYGACSYPPGP
jgi:hypothetical protein